MKIENYVKQNYSFLKNKYGEDAIQQGVLNILEKKPTEINNQYIEKAIKWAFLNEKKHSNFLNCVYLEDFCQTETEEENIEKFFGAIDKNFMSIELKIDIEKKITEMCKNNEKVIEILELFLQGYKIKEIKEITGLSMAVISRIINFKVYQKRKKRKSFDKKNLHKLIELAKQYGIERKSYFKINTDLYKIKIMKDGRIFTNQNIWGGYEFQQQFLVYVDEVDIEIIKQFLEKHIGGRK